jgi:hypothetical protein
MVFFPHILLAGKLGNNNMLTIGNTYKVQTIAFWTSTILIVGFWAKLASTSGFLLLLLG